MGLRAVALEFLEVSLFYWMARCLPGWDAIAVVVNLAPAPLNGLGGGDGTAWATRAIAVNNDWLVLRYFRFQGFLGKDFFQFQMDRTWDAASVKFAVFAYVEKSDFLVEQFACLSRFVHPSGGAWHAEAWRTAVDCYVLPAPARF